MAPTTYTLSPLAYLKLLLHSAKYPHATVNGLLLSPSPQGADEVVLSDTVPLLHHWTGLTPMMEIGMDLASGYAQDNSLRIVGYYEAPSLSLSPQLSPVGERILLKLRSAAPDAVGFVVDAEGLSQGDAGLVAYISSPSIKLIPSAFSPSSNPPVFKLSSPSLPAQALKLLQEGKLQEVIGDFDDHLEDVRVDWLRNGGVGEGLGGL